MAPGETLFAEDPGVPVLLGQTPIVLDVFMLRRLDEVRPRAVDPIVARIERGAFDHVALIMPLDDEDYWWRVLSLRSSNHPSITYSLRPRGHRRRLLHVPAAPLVMIEVVPRRAIAVASDLTVPPQIESALTGRRERSGNNHFLRDRLGRSVGGHPLPE